MIQSINTSLLDTYNDCNYIGQLKSPNKMQFLGLEVFFLPHGPPQSSEGSELIFRFST